MTLLDLNAQFIRHVTGPKGEDIIVKWPHLDKADGLQFQDPKQHELVRIWFAIGKTPNHIGIDQEGNTVRWIPTGSSYENLTLWPSISVGLPGGWHGWIEDGKVRDA